ncbi:MAG TPA: aminotransferase class V-fold PLP-dependent enzyme [Acidimicrobiales bacterium]|nr:aminotransferase class V-fold PLP-dependent enzyme [Acidimicrobiales bacterium]
MTDRHHPFPTEGRPVDDLVAEMRGGRGDDADWRGGRTFSLVYNASDPELERLHEAVAHEYLHENYLNPFAFPSLMRMEREVVAMAADLVYGNPRGGKLTSGGTESLFLAVQVARDHARGQRGIAEPTVVLPSTAHPAFAKACHYLDVDEVRVPVTADGRADPAATRAAVDDRTALVVGSAPCYPYGVVDPIPDLAALATEQGALCHVDACLGGWLLPFLERLGEPIPPWDFRVEGVTSLSADVHKYGWCFKGASLLLHRDEDLLRLQYFLYDGWPGGLYGSATTAGTRPAAPIAAAWATINHLGLEGYLRLAGQVRDASARLRAGVEAIDGVTVTGDPVPGVLEIAAAPPDPGAGAPEVDMSAVGDVMDDRGWHLDRQQGGLHAIVSPSHGEVADRFVADLADAVATHGESRGVEARYGGVE